MFVCDIMWVMVVLFECVIVCDVIGRCVCVGFSVSMCVIVCEFECLILCDFM